jgi:hypothetical protein
MQVIYHFKNNIKAIHLMAVTFLILTSCGTYQQATYDDGIYGTEEPRRETVEVVQDVNPSSNAYQNYFEQKSFEAEDRYGDIFTDVESYTSQNNTEPQTETNVDAIGYSESYSPWGETADNITINVYGGPQIGWSNWGWGWNNWGWNSWGWNRWGWGLGWNNWGWNGWNGWGPGWNNWGWGWNGWGLGFNNWGWNIWRSPYRNYAYSVGRRGYHPRADLANRRANYYSRTTNRNSNRYSTNRSSRRSNANVRNSRNTRNTRATRNSNTRSTRATRSTRSTRATRSTRSTRSNNRPTINRSRSRGSSGGSMRSSGGGMRSSGGSRGGGRRGGRS